MNKPLIFEISHLIDKPTGAQISYNFTSPAHFENIDATSDIKGNIEIMRIDDGVNVLFKNIDIAVLLICEKCLKPFKTKIKIDSAERQFYFKKPNFIDDVFDLFLINNKNLTIDITEPIRQELLLHFPIIKVCSKGCKGLCPHCGKDRNKQKCDCKNETIIENKPFAKLKQLLIKKHGKTSSS